MVFLNYNRSGKTHTMIGSLDNPGLTYQTVMELYRRLGSMENEYETEVVVSYLEVRHLIICMYSRA